MKKISLVLVGVLFCTLVFANGTDEPKTTSSVAVTHANGSTLVKVYYTAATEGNVDITILDEKGKEVYAEKLRKISGFIRPYNFSGLSEGDYSVKITDQDGERIEKVSYRSDKIEKQVSIVKLAEDGKFLVSMSSQSADKVSVNVYDDQDRLIHSQDEWVDKQFAEVLNLKKFKSFTIEVTDNKGLLKSLKY